MFLKEAVAARRNDSSNGGLDDTSFKAARLNLLQTQIGWMFSSGWWTDTDPREAIGYHNLDGYPQWADVEAYLMSCLHPMTQASAGNTYTNLDHVPIEHLFQDIKSLSYTILAPSNSYAYDGYSRQTYFTYRYYYERRYTSGAPRITDETRTTGNWMWYSRHTDDYRTGYPEGIRSLETNTPISCSTTFTENSSATYRRYHRYLEVFPFGVFRAYNEYSADWGDSGQDYWETAKYIIAPFPITHYIDTLTATTFTLDDQAAWDSWATQCFQAAHLQKFATDIQGQYDPTQANRYRRRIALIDPPLYTFWVAHFRYCSLDGVAM